MFSYAESALPTPLFLRFYAWFAAPPRMAGQSENLTFSAKVLAKCHETCYNLVEKQKCGSFQVRQHLETYAGDDAPTQRPKGRTAWDIIRHFPPLRKGVVCRFSHVLVLHQEDHLFYAV